MHSFNSLVLLTAGDRLRKIPLVIATIHEMTCVKLSYPTMEYFSHSVLGRCFESLRSNGSGLVGVGSDENKNT